MSDATRQALSEAIAAHVAAESPGSVVGSWVTLAESTGFEDLDRGESSCFMVSSGNGFINRGLIEFYRDVDAANARRDDDD